MAGRGNAPGPTVAPSRHPPGAIPRPSRVPGGWSGAGGAPRFVHLPTSRPGGPRHPSIRLVRRQSCTTTLAAVSASRLSSTTSSSAAPIWIKGFGSWPRGRACGQHPAAPTRAEVRETQSYPSEAAATLKSSLRIRRNPPSPGSTSCPACSNRAWWAGRRRHLDSKVWPRGPGQRESQASVLNPVPGLVLMAWSCVGPRSISPMTVTGFCRSSSTGARVRSTPLQPGQRDSASLG